MGGRIASVCKRLFITHTGLHTRELAMSLRNSLFVITLTCSTLTRNTLAHSTHTIQEPGHEPDGGPEGVLILAPGFFALLYTMSSHTSSTSSQSSSWSAEL